MGRPKKLPHHEYFRQYTDSELAIIKLNVCMAHKCPYLTFAGDTNPGKNKNITSNKCCNYILYAGKRRNCMPDECIHYKDKNVKRKIKFNAALDY